MMTMCGPTQSGKTHLITEIIEDIDNVIQPTPDKLIYLYTAEQPGYDMQRHQNYKHVNL
jgi:predicted AAA+ superfamily ATPase